MSKAQLKKELLGMEKEHLVELLLNLYTARGEAKEYLEFFLNPDVDAMAMRTIREVQKELMRTRRGYRSKARISVIKALIKNFATLDPGPDPVLRLYSAVFDMAIAVEQAVWFTETFERGMNGLVEQAVKYGFDNGLVETTLDTFDFLNHLTGADNTRFGQQLASTLQQAVAQQAKKMK